MSELRHQATAMRIIDANLNRAREALRVMEEYARLGLDDAGLTAAIKETRHALATALNELEGGHPNVSRIEYSTRGRGRARDLH